MHRTTIDGLRAVAVVSVILHHFNDTLLPNGNLGVDVFFVISGFVITKSLVERRHESLGDFIRGFYARRIKRLVPALFLCITATCLGIFLVVPPGGAASSFIDTGMSALWGLSNLQLYAQAIDYFGASAALNPFTHTWSLGVEEQFYLLFPLLMWSSGLLSGQKWGRKRFLLLVGALAAASLGSYAWLSKANPVAAFYLMPMRFWEIAAGAMAFVCSDTLRELANRRVAAWFGLASSLALAILFVVLFLPTLVHPAAATFAVVLLSSVLVVGLDAGNDRESTAHRVLAWKPVAFIGVLSYSLYLWHWSVLVLSRWTVGVSAWTIPFQLGAIFLLAAMSYRFVERPCRRAAWVLPRLAGDRLAEVKYALALAAGISVVFGLLLSPLHMQGVLYAGKPAPVAKGGEVALEDMRGPGGSRWSAKDCVLSSDRDVGKEIGYEACTLGDSRTASRRFLVIGDSFSVSEIDMYKVLVEQNRGTVTIVASLGASAVPEVRNRSPRPRANAYYWSSVVPKFASALSRGDVLLMIDKGNRFSPPQQDEASRRDIADLASGLSRIAAEMSARGIFVVYQAGNPFVEDSGCTPDTAMPQWWHFGGDPPCAYLTRAQSLERRHAYHASLLRISEAHGNFAVLDLFDVFCPGSVCRFYNADGVFLYRDMWSHPSVDASVLAKPVLLETVDRLTGRAGTEDGGRQGPGVHGAGPGH